MNIRRTVLKALENNDFDVIETCYQEDSNATLRTLQMHVYGLPDQIVRWRAIDMIGRLASVHANEEDEVYRNLIRRFIWQMCEESANVPWASSEVIGSIIGRVPGAQYQEFIGPLFYHAGLNEICQPGLFWAVGMMEEHHRDDVMTFFPEILPRLLQDEADMRAFGAWSLTLLPTPEAVPYLEALFDDTREVPIYENGALHVRRVSDLAKLAYERCTA